MRLNNSMRANLVYLIMRDTDFGEPSMQDIHAAFVQAESTKLPKEVYKFLTNNPDYRCNTSINFALKLREIFPLEQLQELQLEPKQYTQISVENLNRKDDEPFYYHSDYVNGNIIARWFKEDKPCEFVGLIRKKFLAGHKYYRMKRDLENFLQNCTTDKQILLTYPRLEKYFNEAGIVSSNGGRALPVPFALTEALEKHLK